MQYDQDVVTWSPQGRIHQIEYAMEAVKQGSAVVGLKVIVRPKCSVAYLPLSCMLCRVLSEQLVGAEQHTHRPSLNKEDISRDGHISAEALQD